MVLYPTPTRAPYGSECLSVSLIYFTLHYVLLCQQFNSWQVKMNTAGDGDAIQLLASVWTQQDPTCSPRI